MAINPQSIYARGCSSFPVPIANPNASLRDSSDTARLGFQQATGIRPQASAESGLIPETALRPEA